MNPNDTHKLYLDIASRIGQESYCERAKVGAVIVTKNNGTFIGFNGAPEGAPNICELPNGTTAPWVIHAEENALAKMLKEGVPAEDAIVYNTLSPCPGCTRLMHTAGIRQVYYKDIYRDISHFPYWEDLGMVFTQIKE